jgi:hypothetical protein
MISYDKFNFLYVAITRTGSESIRWNLRNCGLAYVWNKGYPHPDIPWLHTGHYSALEWRKVLGEENFNKRFKFTIVRNPWSKMVSHYTIVCKDRKHGYLRRDRDNRDKFNAWIQDILGNHVVQPCFPRPKGKLPQFSEEQRALCDHERTPHWNCLDWITDEDGNIIVDFIGRYETHAEDYKKALALIEERFGHPIPKPKPLKKINVSNWNHNYRYYYSDESIELVRRCFEKDIEEFGFEY